MTARSLSELKERVVCSLALETYTNDKQRTLSVHLAEDDTEIDDEDYFATLPNNTKLLIKVC